MKFSYQDYKNGKCSGIEYCYDHFIGQENDGEVQEIKLSDSRSIFIMKRIMEDYYGKHYIEFKTYDIDSNRGCLDKKKEYEDLKKTLKKYWKETKIELDMANFLTGTLELGW